MSRLCRSIYLHLYVLSFNIVSFVVSSIPYPCIHMFVYLYVPFFLCLSILIFYGCICVYIYISLSVFIIPPIRVFVLSFFSATEKTFLLSMKSFHPIQVFRLPIRRATLLEVCIATLLTFQGCHERRKAAFQIEQL